MERSEGRVELTELLKREMYWRALRRQSNGGKGPAMLELDKSRE